jgi:glycosyltransferase involved in cell wall biosynthesis
VSALELSIVVPAHNEVSLLGSTVTNLVAGMAQRTFSYEIILVENGSHDGTLRLARVLAAQIPTLRVLTLPQGDYGAALAAGFTAARGDVVVNVDVDYYSLAFIDAAMSLLHKSNAQMVLASKRMKGARDRRPIVRRVLTYGFAVASRSLLASEVSDAHGMKAMWREPMLPIVERCVMRGSLFDVELVLRASQSGKVISELPSVVVERRPPRTSLAARSLESFIGLVRLRMIMAKEGRARGSH